MEDAAHLIRLAAGHALRGGRHRTAQPSPTPSPRLEHHIRVIIGQRRLGRSNECAGCDRYGTGAGGADANRTTTSRQARGGDRRESLTSDDARHTPAYAACESNARQTPSIPTYNLYIDRLKLTKIRRMIVLSSVTHGYIAEPAPAAAASRRLRRGEGEKPRLLSSNFAGRSIYLPRGRELTDSGSQKGPYHLPHRYLWPAVRPVSARARGQRLSMF